MAKELEDCRRLREADFTYRQIGATTGPLPAGYHHLSRRVTVGHGPERFEEAAHTLLSWGMHRRAGLHVRASSDTVADGAVALLRLGLWRLALEAPVRVVYVVDEPRRRGFAYGTLPGHPESGEEAFVVELGGDGAVTLTITAFSRPRSTLARVAGPLGRVAQGWVTARYLHSV